MESPSQKLALRIVERLINEKLIAPGDAKKIASKLAEGKLKGEDWRVAIELAEQKNQS